MHKNYSREVWEAYFDFEISNLNEFAVECDDYTYDDEDEVDLSIHKKLNMWNAYQQSEKEMAEEDDWYLGLMWNKEMNINV